MIPKLILQFEAKREAKKRKEVAEEQTRVTEEQIKRIVAQEDEVEVMAVPQEEHLVNLDPNTPVKETPKVKRIEGGSHKEEEVERQT